MTRKILIIYFFLLLGTTSFSQFIPSSSQYMVDQLMINPAYAGNREVATITTTYKSQWTGFEGAPKTQNIVFHTPVNKKKIGLGLSVLSDKIGINKHTAFFSYYSYRIPFQDGKLSIGLSLGINVLKSSFNEIKTINPNDVVFVNPVSYNHINFGTGLFYKNRKFFVGLSTPYLIDFRHENVVENNASTNHVNIFLSSGAIFSLNNNFRLKPSFLFKTYPPYTSQLDLNCSVIYNDVLWVGLSLRSDDAFSWLIEYQLTPQLRFGFSHDFPFTKIARFSYGTNEILLRYEFSYKTNAKGVKFF